MDALDGNALAGQLFDYFGAEMTTINGTCRHCGAVAQIAELVVYARAPGTVVRCRACGKVVIVLVEIRGATQIDLSAFSLDDSPAARDLPS